MVMDVVRILLEDYSREDFTIQIPNCFEILKGTDANFELVQPLTTQPVKISYVNNIVTKSVAVIFAHTNVKGLQYAKVHEKTEKYRELLEDILGFEVEVLMDQSKEQMITKLESLKQIASQFEANRSARDTLAIAVCHVGFNLQPEVYPPHRPLVMEMKEFQRPDAAADNSEYWH